MTTHATEYCCNAVIGARNRQEYDHEAESIDHHREGSMLLSKWRVWARHEDREGWHEDQSESSTGICLSRWRDWAKREGHGSWYEDSSESSNGICLSRWRAWARHEGLQCWHEDSSESSNGVSCQDKQDQARYEDLIGRNGDVK